MPTCRTCVWASALVLALAASATAQQERSRSEAPPPARRCAALRATLVVHVARADEAIAAVVGAAKRSGGFPVLVTDRGVAVKVPPERLAALLELVGEQGVLLAKELERRDLTQHVAQLEASLRSKSAILDRLRALFASADLRATLEIEREMNGLVEEIEGVKGELRVARECCRWAVVSVQLRLPEREQVVAKESSFEWLNSVDVERFEGRFYRD